jgi:hypothetical protein
MADIVEAWMWRNPEEIIERLLVNSARQDAPRPVIHVAARENRDRYYTRARRHRVKQLMKGR